MIFLAALLAASQAVPQASADRYARCSGARDILSRAVNVIWEPRNTMLKEHHALRTRLKAAFPEAPTRLLFHSIGRHHSSAEFSVIATRDASGGWRTDGVGETGPGLLAVPTEPMTPFGRALTAAQGERLDQLLADRCLATAPRFMRDSGLTAGGAVQTLEIETPQGRQVMSWHGLRTAEQEEIITLIATP